MRHPIYHFLVDTELSLPCTPAECSGSLAAASYPFKVDYADVPLDGFEDVRWIGRRYEGYLRSYDVGDGVLVRAGEQVSLHLHAGARSATVHFPDPDFSQVASLEQAADLEFNRSFAIALLVNLGLSISALLEGRLALHGAAAKLDGKMVGILAPSGTGKTTLLWEILRLGGLFASDDVFTVRMREGNILSFPSMSLDAKLSGEAMEAQNRDRRNYREMLPGSDEFWVSMPPEERVLSEHRISALFALHPRPPGTPESEVSVVRIVSGAAIAILMQNTQGLWACHSQVDARRMFKLYESIAVTVPVYSIRYTRTLEALPALVQVIREIAGQSE